MPFTALKDDSKSATTEPRSGSVHGGTRVELSTFGHVLLEQFEACNCEVFVYLEGIDAARFEDWCVLSLWRWLFVCPVDMVMLYTLVCTFASV